MSRIYAAIAWPRPQTMGMGSVLDTVVRNTDGDGMAVDITGQLNKLLTGDTCPVVNRFD